jgi:hypothetical protein
MAFIRTIAPSDADGPVRDMYQEAHRRYGYIPNWTRAFSLRPASRGAARMNTAGRMSVMVLLALSAACVTQAKVEWADRADEPPAQAAPVVCARCHAL